MTEDLVVIEHEPHAPLAQVQVAPQVQATELVARIDVIREAMQQAMQQNVDYGVIPGTGTKPTLLKPGAEKLGALFQLDVQLENEKTWHDDGHLTVVSRATVFHQPTGTRLGSGEGICTTREAKYAYRKGERVCPSCGAAAIIKGKAEYGGGWLCWKNHKTTPGCGAKFNDGDPVIEGQSVDRVANPDIADAYNTVDKMASKRARIDAVLAVTGASALFTQDVEDLPQFERATEAARPAEASPALRKKQDDIEALFADADAKRGVDPGTTLAEAMSVKNMPVADMAEADLDELGKRLGAFVYTLTPESMNERGFAPYYEDVPF